jgi:hypothetical protein
MQLRQSERENKGHSHASCRILIWVLAGEGRTAGDLQNVCSPAACWVRRLGKRMADVIT